MSILRNKVISDVYLTTFKESKLFERKGKLHDALAAIEKLSSDACNILFPIAIDITKQIASLCNKLVSKTSSPVLYLRRAEQVLTTWMNLCNNHKLHLDEKIFRLILLTFNNWATFHQTSKNYHMSLSYLMRGLKVIDKFPALHPDSLQLIAKTRLNTSTLYSELRRYKEAIKHAEESLATLQVEMKIRLDGKTVSKLSKRDKAKVKLMITTYVIAFYTIGLAEEANNKRQAMLEAYNNALKIGSQFLADDNEVLKALKKTLDEAILIGDQACENKPKRYIPQKELKIHLVEQFDTKIEPFEYKSTPQPQDSMKNIEIEHLNSKISLPNLNLSPETEIKRPGRYYSDEQLRKLQKKLTIDSQHKFVSADDFFYSKISKTLNVKSDIRYLRPLTSKGAINK